MEPPSRFKLWASYAAFTCVLLIAIAQVETDADENLDDPTGKSDRSWGLALTILSLFSIVFVLISHVNQSLRSKIIDKKPEGIILILLIIFSTVVVGLVSGPDRGLAVDKEGSVFEGNMYYFAWMGFINGILILSSFIETVYGFNVRQTMRSRSSSFTYWTALLVSSIIVMGTSADLYNRNCDVDADDKPQPFCSRSVLAVTVGTMGVILSLTIVAMKISVGAAPFLLEVGLTLILFILYVVEVAYVTDIQGPGSPLGNLYYFSWISFGLTFMVGKACHEDYVEAQIIVEQQQNRMERPMPSLATVEQDRDWDRSMDNGAGAGLGKIDDDDMI